MVVSSPPQAVVSEAETGIGDADDGDFLGFESKDEGPWANEPNFGFDPPPALAASSGLPQSDSQ
eukprot:7504550-Pyramimonas_sp.AAC.1